MEQDTRMTAATEYDSRYLKGVLLFNRAEYFEAHEVWEDLWHETAGPERRFIQGLIQAAVCVYHASNGNALGSRRLFHSGRRYMSGFAARHLGVDAEYFWNMMEQALAEFLFDQSVRVATLQVEFIPKIALLPEPHFWPEDT